MKKLLLSLLALMLITPFTFGQGKWVLDKSHSSMRFEVAHMVISTTEGQFKDFDIEFKSSGTADMGDSKIVATARINSINTDDEKRDGHLKSADFFDAENHPEMKFESTKFEKVKGNKYELTGNLTMRGTTHPVTFDVRLNGKAKDPWGNMRSGWKATATIDRTQWGLEWNKALEAGGVLVGEEIDIIMNVELIAQ